MNIIYIEFSFQSNFLSYEFFTIYPPRTLRWIVKNPYDQKVDKKEELELIFTIYLSDFNKIFFEKTYWALFEVVELKNKHFKQRNIFRDNGIVISISVLQCSVEFIFMITCSFYIYILNGYSKTFDKFFNIYLSIVTVIILPTFYLNGEAAFRRNLAAYGPFRALKNAIVGKLWMAEEIVFCCIHLNATTTTKKTTKFRLVLETIFLEVNMKFFLELNSYI